MMRYPHKCLGHARPMKISHHPSLILMGWLLMVPPLVTRSGLIYLKPDTDAPLTEWRPNQDQVPSYDSKQACERFRAANEVNARNLLHDAPSDIERMTL